MILLIWTSVILAEEFANGDIHILLAFAWKIAHQYSYNHITINLYRFFCEQLSAPEACRSHRRCPTRGFPSLTREFRVTIFSCWVRQYRYRWWQQHRPCQIRGCQHWESFILEAVQYSSQARCCNGCPWPRPLLYSIRVGAALRIPRWSSLFEN